ncbi:MAG: hypothetical protein LPK19_10800 [Hymenobacteraceae bacterium]|nr:hypothetical protein [Hymenobacteraceae bacterium]MDX5396724.1 hypothetical protein [Hymenobacteraceae bacterium]MDX5512784.1 hypothetical protein [Hymenobacteraceae bacterium]
MIRDYFHNPFLSASITPEYLVKLAENHLEQLQELNEAGKYTHMIQETQQLIPATSATDLDSATDLTDLAVQLYKNLGALIQEHASDPDMLHQYYGDPTPGTREEAL